MTYTITLFFRYPMRVFVINLVHAGAIALLSPLLPWGVLPAQSAPAIAQADPAAQLAEGDRLSELGDQQYQMSQFTEAIQFWQQALRLYQDSEVRSTFFQESLQKEGIILRNLAIAYRRIGLHQEAVNFEEQRLIIARETEDSRSQASALNNLGTYHASSRQYEQAINFFRECLSVARDFGYQDLEITTLGNIGLSYISLDQYPEAGEFYSQQLVVSREAGNRESEATALGGLGIVALSLGHYHQATELYQQSLVVARETGDKQAEGRALGNLANSYSSLGQYQTAIGLYEQRINIAREFEDRQGEGNGLGNLAIIYRNLEQYQVAIDLYEQQLAIARELGDKQNEGISLGGLGNTYISLGQYQKAIHFSGQHLAIAQEIGDQRGQSIALNSLGLAYFFLGGYEESADFHRQSIALAQEIGTQGDVGSGLNNLALSYHESGLFSLAIDALKMAIDVFESMQIESLPDASKISFFDTYLRAYQNLQISLIAQNNTEQALVFSERGRSRALADLLAIRVSGNSDSDAPLLNSVEALSLAGIQRVAREQQATLVQYSAVSSQELFIWVIQPTGEIAFQAVDLAGQDLPELVSLVRETLGVRGSDRGDIFIAHSSEASEQQQAERQQRLQQLHQLLIAPIASHLPTDPTQRVVIIPHQDLFLVPFAALVNADGQYLIENHTLLTAPSIQVLDLTHQQRLATGPSTLQGSEMLIVGNPTMPSVWNPLSNQVTQLSPLKGAENEAIAIANDFGTEALLGDRATKAAVVQHMPQARIIHFATHGLLEYGTPEDSGVLDVPGAIALAPNGDDAGLLTSAEILQLNLTADLVVLSACDTGRGRITGDGVIGLSRAFTTAGVPSLMVSLWAVDDESTAALMQAFYFHWQQTGDKAQALRQAMLTTLQDYPDPRLWAAFTLIGAAE
ncbi:CHAT domain-containing tetratricopeptide repeat protein [Nodosilinea sp. E11]|uniref:CHAT domain-containing tetratricopeptide repeat protein n=1 Tax=Nodosilinea sp. E11 TaxID=3037479 RepID=UPI0029348EBA|nr:CHAT domain-containing protein [Nodosilinea sp. E11]WOD39776.1 CHAT domain-containing protein [Nodosilinea sp. E11]